MDKVTFNKEDLVDHHCVSAIVFNNDRSKIIQLYHNKLQLWTVPVGKCDKSVGPERTLIREIKEEIDIWPVEFEEVHVFEKTYMRGNIPVKVTNHIFVVNSYIIVSFYIGCDRPNGEAANDAFDAEFNQVMNAPVTPYIKAFNDELESRGMTKDDIQKNLRYHHTPTVEVKKTRRFGYHLCPIHQQEYLQYCSCCVLELHAQKKRKRHGKKKKESIC